MKTFSKGILIILILTVFLVVIIFIDQWNKSIRNNEKRYEITTSLQDKFIISEKLLRTYPDYTYNVEIYDFTNEEKISILKINNAEGIENEKITFLCSNDKIKAYSYLNYIIYKEKSRENFKSLDIGEFEKLAADKNAYLIPVAKEIMHNSWGFAHYVSEFLIESNDSDAINTIKRYAEGKFNSEEIENNKYTGLSSKEMQEYFKSLLIKYNLLPSTEETKLTTSTEEFYSITHNNDTTYTIKLLDKNKKVINELTVPKEPYVIKLEDDVIQIIISYGSPFYATYFYNTKASLISQMYDTPVLVKKGKIVIIENNNLIISDIFNKDVYYKEVKKDFTQIVPSSSAIISAKFVDSSELQINYYEGEDFAEKLEILDLSK